MNRTTRTTRVEVEFVDALCKKSCRPQSCNAIRNFACNGFPLGQRKVYICILVCVCFLDLPVHLALAASLEFKQTRIPFAPHGSPPLFVVKRLETRNLRLFEIFPQNPSCMEFLVCKVVT